MPAKRSFREAISNAVVLHVLCLGVLLFAFQAKLTIYRASADPSVRGSKLSIQKNTTTEYSAIGDGEPIKAKHEFRLYSIEIRSTYRSPLHMPSDRTARIALVAFSRLNDEMGSHFHRPPPTLL
jgi:hypothetical protein